MFKSEELFDLAQTEHAKLFDDCEFAWDALKRLKNYVKANLRPALRNRCVGNAFIDENVFIGEGTIIEDGVMIKGSVIIGKNCEIRQGAYIREHSVIGDNCVVGHCSEIKHSVLFNGAQVPHFNYVGDSILGHKAHLGAGVKISNVKLVPGNIFMEIDGKPFDTGLRKFGALLGDFAEVGCNSVLNPGSIIGRNSIIYPNVNWREIL
ncbi:MAG: UDP-N-acetylglucosamine diphosphorylase, partial [Verrucomicrobiota bacterium]